MSKERDELEKRIAELEAEVEKREQQLENADIDQSAKLESEIAQANRRLRRARGDLDEHDRQQAEREREEQLELQRALRTFDRAQLEIGRVPAHIDPDAVKDAAAVIAKRGRNAKLGKAAKALANAIASLRETMADFSEAKATARDQEAEQEANVAGPA